MTDEKLSSRLDALAAGIAAAKADADQRESAGIAGRSRRRRAVLGSAARAMRKAGRRLNI